VNPNPGWERVQKVRTHEHVLAQIEAKILDGELRIGEKLPSERELVEALGVSRSSVREALRALEAMGIIDSHTGTGKDSGSVVSGRSSQALGNLLRLHIALARISVGDLVEIRVQLERNAASNAARCCSVDDIAHLRQLTTRMRTATLRSADFNELDTEFHIAIARASGNALSYTLMPMIRDAVKAEMIAAFAGLTNWRAVADRLCAEHQRIVDAIEAKEPELAAQLVAEHIERFYQDQVLERREESYSAPRA